MSTLLLVIATSFGAISLGVSVVSLALHWARRNEHPDVAQLKADHLDLLDKVEHWMKRDRVRRLRQGQEDKAALEGVPEVSVDRKTQLRRVLRERQQGAA